MANLEHVMQLMHGVESWNKWRRQQRARGRLLSPDLSNVAEAFKGESFQNADLAEVKLAGTNLSWSDFRHANLTASDLSAALLEQN